MVGIAEASPRLKARLAGGCELLEGSTAAGSQVVIVGMLVVGSDTAAEQPTGTALWTTTAWGIAGPEEVYPYCR